MLQLPLPLPHLPPPSLPTLPPSLSPVLPEALRANGGGDGAAFAAEEDRGAMGSSGFGASSMLNFGDSLNHKSFKAEDIKKKFMNMGKDVGKLGFTGVNLGSFGGRKTGGGSGLDWGVLQRGGGVPNLALSSCTPCSCQVLTWWWLALNTCKRKLSPVKVVVAGCVLAPSRGAAPKTEQCSPEARARRFVGSLATNSGYGTGQRHRRAHEQCLYRAVFTAAFGFLPLFRGRLGAGVVPPRERSPEASGDEHPEHFAGPSLSAPTRGGKTNTGVVCSRSYAHQAGERPHLGKSKRRRTRPTSDACSHVARDLSKEVHKLPSWWRHGGGAVPVAPTPPRLA